MNPQLHREIYQALSELEFDPDTRVLVLTSAGGSFCARQELEQYPYELKDDPRGREEIRSIPYRARVGPWRRHPAPGPCARSIQPLLLGVPIGMPVEVMFQDVQPEKDEPFTLANFRPLRR